MQNGANGANGVGRRAFLRRSAVAAGAIWAAPAIRTVAPAVAQASPPNCACGDHEISHISFIYQCGTLVYGQKINVVNQVTGELACEEIGKNNDCDKTLGDDPPEPNPAHDFCDIDTTNGDALYAPRAAVNSICTNGTITITLPAGCTFTPSVAIKCGQLCDNSQVPPLNTSVWTFCECG